MIIGLVGFKQVGKSTAAEYLAETYDFARLNMKDPLVREIKQKFPDLLAEILKVEIRSKSHFGNGDEVESIIEEGVDYLFRVKPPLMRALLQNYGTEVRRGDDSNYWSNQWEVAAAHEGDQIVVDDVRFINEAEAVRRRGGIIIRLVRPDITTGGSHASEVEQEKIEADYTILCEPGDHEDLYKSLDEIVKIRS